MSDHRKIDLKEQVLARVRKIADPGLQALAASSPAASTDSQLAAFAQRAFSSAIPQVIEVLKTRMTPALARIDGEIERKERERTLLTRSSNDELLWYLDEAMQITMEILRRLLPEAAIAHANIEFSESVSLPIACDLHGAIEQSEKAQEELFMQCVSQVREVLDSLSDEAAASISAADKRMGGGVFRRPARMQYRPPQHFFIDFYVVLDRYEQVRVSTQGMGQLHAIRPQWLRKLLMHLPRFGGMELGEIIGGISGFDSLSQAKRMQLRRELCSIAAEQRRRVLAAAHEQAGSFFRDLKSAVLSQSRTHYYATYDALTARLAELGRERRKALDYWATTERALKEAESCARQLFALTT